MENEQTMELECAPKEKHVPIFNTDFALIAFTAAVVHTYAMLYTIFFIA